MLKNILPSFYQNILPQGLLDLQVNETRATCNHCLKSRDHRFKEMYNADLKCCTFEPFVPNFSVGALLYSDNQSSSLASMLMQHKISGAKFTLPLGIVPTLKYQYAFTKKKKFDFGNREDLLCSYYDSDQKQCGIWSHRGVVCTTYYCTSNYGNAGKIFWKSLNDYLSYVEMVLAEECLVQFDFSPRDISDQLSYLNRKNFSLTDQNCEKLSSKKMKLIWNGYDNLENFYKKCFDHVMNIDRKEFKTMLFDRGLNLEKTTLDLGRAL